MEAIRTSEKRREKSASFPVRLALGIACFGLFVCQTASANDGEGKNLPLIRAWRGDYPVSQLHRGVEEGERSIGV